MAGKANLYDMHCHLDFADNAKDVAREAEGSVVAVNATVVPSSYAAACTRFENAPWIHVAVGVHPWWVAENRIGEANLTRFESALANTNLVGEIGLDFHGERRETRMKQIEVLTRLLQAIKDAGDGKLVFLHAVKCYDDIFGLLDRFGTPGANTCVFHWFSGSREDFGRALSEGFYFSVGMRMMASGNGAFFATAIPDDKLLIETDNPPHEGMPWSAETWEQEIRNTARGLAELRGTTEEAILDLTRENSIQLLQKYDAS